MVALAMKYKYGFFIVLTMMGDRQVRRILAVMAAPMVSTERSKQGAQIEKPGTQVCIMCKKSTSAMWNRLFVAKKMTGWSVA